MPFAHTDTGALYERLLYSHVYTGLKSQVHNQSSRPFRHAYLLCLLFKLWFLIVLMFVIIELCLWFMLFCTSNGADFFFIILFTYLVHFLQAMA